jgi:formylglycine-generating enzyme required for sulfatase activity
MLPRIARPALSAALLLTTCSRTESAASERGLDGEARLLRSDAADAAPDAGGGAAPRPAPSPPAGELPEQWRDMRLVPAGPFTMGCDDRGELDERPAHTVTLAAFYLDITEVSNEAYARCVETGACEAPDPRNADRNHFGPDSRFRGPKQPVSSIPWDSARAYCAFVGKRLPREAELEKAARGTDGRRYPWGDDDPDEQRAVFQASVTADVGTHPLGKGPYGHLDLAGNVWEWMEDIYDPYAYRRPSASRGEPGSCEEVIAAQNELRRDRREGFTGSNPIPVECERVLRGGAFNYPLHGLRATNRVHHPGRFRLVMSGVRCAADADAALSGPR